MMNGLVNVATDNFKATLQLLGDMGEPEDKPVLQWSDSCVTKIGDPEVSVKFEPACAIYIVLITYVKVTCDYTSTYTDDATVPLMPL